ncbi:MAG: hypothetical protein QHH24_06950 [Candidatus Bathyarchaeota archaeon]|nr:hypothetical protein [Candidatus Bathyarchaeota archaeon]
MIGIATTVFWIFVVIFAVSAMYSVKDLRFEFGEPQASVTSEGKMLLSMPITIVNTGYYNIRNFNVTTLIFDAENMPIVQGSTSVPIIQKGREITTSHNITFSIADLLQKSERYLFEDVALRAEERIGLWAAEVIPVEARANISLPWGAPLYNFALGTPQYSAYNRTHMRAEIPISFENHAFFDLACNVGVRMFDDSSRLLGAGATSVEALQHSAYDGSLTMYVPVPTSDTSMTSGYFEVNFASSLFSFGPMVIHYG